MSYYHRQSSRSGRQDEAAKAPAKIMKIAKIKKFQICLALLLILASAGCNGDKLEIKEGLEIYLLEKTQHNEVPTLDKIHLPYNAIEQTGK